MKIVPAIMLNNDNGYRIPFAPKKKPAIAVIRLPATIPGLVMDIKFKIFVLKHLGRAVAQGKVLVLHLHVDIEMIHNPD